MTWQAQASAEHDGSRSGHKWMVTNHKERKIIK